MNRNRNRLKQNLKNIVDEERHLRFVRDEETRLYVPYENEAELRLMADRWEMYKIAFGHIDNETGLYVEDAFTESYYSPGCLLFNDEDYYEDVRCFVTYWGAYEVQPCPDGEEILSMFSLFRLKIRDDIPLGYERTERAMSMGTIVE